MLSWQPCILPSLERMLGVIPLLLGRKLFVLKLKTSAAQGLFRCSRCCCPLPCKVIVQSAESVCEEGEEGDFVAFCFPLTRQILAC